MASLGELTVNIRARVGTDLDECRMLALPVTVRAKTDDEGPVLEGYAALFDEWAQIGDDQWGFHEAIAPGAFRDSIKGDDIRAFFNHDSNQVLGRTSAKTLTLEEDKKGLRAVIHPPDTQAARDVVTLIQRGDVTGMSFMFRVRKDQWEEPSKKGELPKRTLLDVQLFEAGPVTFPAYEQTSISARDRAKSYLDAEQSAVRAAAADADRMRQLRLARAACI